jgi:hypothetical protein
MFLIYNYKKKYFQIFSNENIFFIQENLIPRKTHFMGLGERVKPQLSQTLIKNTRPTNKNILYHNLQNILNVTKFFCFFINKNILESAFKLQNYFHS